jgi:hypothetical protein
MSAATSASSRYELFSEKTVQVIAFCPILAVSVAYKEVVVSETSVACCFLLVIRSSACAMVEPAQALLELTVVFVEIASNIKINSLQPVDSMHTRTDVNSLPGSPNDDLQAMSNRPRAITLPGACMMDSSGSTLGVRM